MQSKWTWTFANELKNLHLNQLESYLTLLHCSIQPTSQHQHPNPFHLINPNHNISHSASQPGYHLIHKLILEKILNRLENYFNFGENILHFWIWIILISSSLKSKHISQQQSNACEVNLGKNMFPFWIWKSPGKRLNLNQITLIYWGIVHIPADPVH